MVYTTNVSENNDILGSAPSTVVIPDFNTTLESAIFVGSLCEEAYTDLMESIGLKELVFYESTGSEIVYEDGNGNETSKGAELKNKITGFFKKIWDGIKAMFEKAIKWFQEKLAIARKNRMDKIIAAWKKNYVRIPQDKTFGTAKYVPALLNNRGSKYYTGWIQTINSFAETAANKLASGQETDAFQAFQNAANIDWIRQAKSVKDLKKVILDHSNVSSEGVQITTKYVNEHISDLAKIVVEGVDLKDIKENYRILKGKVNKLANEVKKAKAENFKAHAKAATQVLSVVSAFNGVYIDIIKSRYNEANKIMTSVAVALRFGKKNPLPPSENVDSDDSGSGRIWVDGDYDTNESAVVSAIEAAFNW